MPSAPIPVDESGRQSELDRYAVVSTPPEMVFDRITRLASHFFHCPVALLSFVEGQRQWFKSCVGLGFVEGPRSESFCSWAILDDDVMVVPDAAADPRFCDNPLVTKPAGVRFYAGAPLISPLGYKLGTLCVVDVKPRPQGLTREECGALADMAGLAMSALEARLAAQEGEETRHLLEATLASMGDGVIVTDAQARVSLINPAAEQITGWREEEAAAKPLENVFPAADGLLMTKDGRQVAIEDTATPIFRNGSKVGGVLIFRDVTKRRAAELALQYSENQYRTAFANAPIGLVLTELNGRYLESNEAYRRISGYAEDELRARSFLSITHADDLENNRALFHRLVKGEVESYVIEKRILNKDGEVRWVRAHAALLRDVRGNSSKVIGLVEDITDAKHAAERFRFLADSIPQMVWTAKPDGLIDYVNAQGMRYLGISQMEATGGNWIQQLHPDDRAAATQRWRESLETGTLYETEFRLRRSDGAWRRHLARAVALISERGQITHWFGTCTDIEQQHQVVKQIEEDRRRWRELLFQAPAAIAVLRGREHVLEWVNPVFETMVRRPASLVTGQTVVAALPELAAQGYVGMLDHVYQTGQPFHGHESLARVGTENDMRDLYVNFICLPTRNTAGEIDGIFAHVTDVTGEVTARKAIEDRESQFRTLAESIPHLTWMADETGHLFWYNQRWFDYTGTTLDQMQGWGWDKVHDPEILPEVVKTWRRALASGEPVEMIFPLRGADGEFRPFLTRVVPIRDSSGRVVRWFGTNTDITEQRRTEEKLRRINRDLEEFSYVASHDLQEPLRMVNIYTQLMLKGKDGSKEDLDLYAGYIAEGVKRMDVLIHDLLSFARSVHADELDVGSADLADAFQDALSVLKSRIEETAAEIQTGILPVTRGDVPQLSHVFQNILSNALKYRKAGVVPRVQVAAVREGAEWIVSIRDNGIGFEPKYADRIFGLFKRLHKDEYPGTGLGLAICKRIVERYGGRMWADSEPGQGSTFYLSLPAAD
jgi:PAS domain S-box-containing protein